MRQFCVFCEAFLGLYWGVPLYVNSVSYGGFNLSRVSETYYMSVNYAIFWTDADLMS